MRTIKYVLLLLVCLLTACNSGNSNSSSKEQGDGTKVEKTKVLSAEGIYKQNISKVAMIISYKDGIPYSQGSGFFIDKNTLVTNFHCVAGAERVEFKVAGNEEVYKGAKVVKASDDYDLAIIKTKQDFPFVKIDSLGQDKVGSKIYAIGNPRGLEGTISDGILSGKRDGDGIEYLQITAPINPGNSGGPVLNEKGEVIGVATFTFRNSQSLNFAMPIKYIKECVDIANLTKAQPKRNFGMDNNAVTMINYHCPTIGNEKYSLKNNTNDDIFNIYGIIVYKTMSGEIFNFRKVFYEEIIPSGLAKILIRVNLGSDYVYYKSVESYDDHHNLTKFQTEFRLISYEIDE